MLERLTKFLFGYDFFISYAYADGRGYAEALNEKLANLDFACFFDASELPPGEQLPLSLKRAIRRSKAVILVGTEGSIEAPYVNLEVSFALNQNKVIPIDVDAIRERVTSAALRELPWVNEEQDSRSGPSAGVLESISNFFKFSKRNTITRRIVSAMATIFFIVAVIAVWQWRVAVQQRKIAEHQRDLALSRQIAGQSKAFLAAEPDLALLLAAAAGKLSVTFEARDALLRGLQKHPGLVRILHGARPVRSLVFSPDGNRLASAGSKGEILIWDANTGKRDAALRTPNGKAARILAFDQSGKILIAYAKNEALGAWKLTPNGPVLQLDTGDYSIPEAEKQDGSVSALVAKIKERTGKRIRATAVTPIKDILATSDGETIRLWSVKNDEPLGAPLSVQKRYVRALAFSSRRMLASGSSAGTIALWDLGNPLYIGHAYKGLNTASNSFAFSPDGRQLAGGDYDGDIAVWQLKNTETRRSYMDHGANVRNLRYGLSNQLASFGGAELKIWDSGTHQLVRSIPIKMKMASASAIDPNIKLAALGGNSGEIALWDIETGNQLPEIDRENRSRITTMAFQPNGTILASAGNSRSIHLLDTGTGQMLGKLDGHTRALSDLDFSGDGRRLASYDSDGTLMVWDMTTLQPIGKPLQRSESYSGISAMALSPDGETAVTSDKAGALNFWHVDTWRPLGNPVKAHKSYVTKLEFSADGNWLVSGGLGGEVYLWDLRIDTWITRVCAIANRKLSAQEIEAYLIDSAAGETVCAERAEVE